MSVDIVNLIESNKLTKLTGNYQSLMIDKIKETFTTYEQQLFVSSFYCYLNHNDSDFVIDLDNVWKWLGFHAKQKSKILLEKNFIENIDYKLLLSHDRKQTNDARGGHNKETIMLTINTFKRFCLKAGTKKADEIHEYYIKMEKIIQDVVIEECKTLSDQLKSIQIENAIDIEKREADYKIKINKQRECEKEKLLLNQFTISIPIVYIIRVKTFENGEYIVKIGESRRGIIGRYNEHKSKYPECCLLDVFAVQQSKDFESYIHNHEKIRSNQVRNMEKHENENELFLVGKNLTYQIIIDIINSQIDNYQEYGTKKIEMEIEKLKIISTNQDGPAINELLESNKRMEESNKELHNRLNKLESLIEKLLETKPTRVHTGFQEQLPTLGPRVQKINPETLHLIKVYESATEVMCEDRSIKRPSLSKAVLENTIYNGFRWLFIERDMDPYVLHNLKPTRPTIVKNMDYVVKLNINQTEILNIYLDRKTASLMNGYSISGLDNAVKNGTISQGYYYKLYRDCDKILIESFQEKYGKEVLLYKDGVGVYENEKLIKEYKCKYDCIKYEKISDKTLARALKENRAYNGYIYAELPSRISCYPEI